MRGTAARKDCTSDRENSWKVQCLLPCASVCGLPAELALFYWWNGITSLEGEWQTASLGKESLARDRWKVGWSAADSGWQSILPIWWEFQCQDCKAISTGTWRGNRNASLIVTIRIHCRWKTFWAMVKIWSHDNWAVSKKVFSYHWDMLCFFGLILL